MTAPLSAHSTGGVADERGHPERSPLGATRGPTPPPRSGRAVIDALVAACRAAGTTHLFGVPGGGSNLDVIGAARSQGIDFVLVHSESAAAVMAGVHGELTGAPGMCLATRGPGAASAVNGVAQALLDRQPMVLVTECVPRSDRDRISHQRLDQQALMTTVSLASVVLDGRESDAPARAVGRTLAARRGPVHVDIDPVVDLPPDHGPAADDVGAGQILRIDPVIDAAPALHAAVTLARTATRAVIVVGVGAIAQPVDARGRLLQALDDLGRRTQIPVLCTYKARGAVPDRAPWCAGVATGARIESPVLDAADLIIGIGLDPVELIPAPWSYRAPLVLLGSWAVDDSEYFGVQLAVEAVGDLASMVQTVTGVISTSWPQGAGQRFRRRAARALMAAVPQQPVGLTPQQVVAIASAAAPSGTVATVDAGAHMLLAVPLWQVETPGQLLVSSGLATMGFALPAAIAAALCTPGRPVVCFTGDGGLGMVLAELETVARLGLPIVVVVFNDAALSLIAAKQQPRGHGGPAAVSYLRTDFAAVATACGLRALRVEDAAGFEAAMGDALRSGLPALLDVVVDPSAYVEVLRAVRTSVADRRA